MKTFICSKCKGIYGWVHRGGTSKMVADPVKYSLKNVTECAYCVGIYPNGIKCKG